ncbi:MAG: glycerate kinase [Verrucomicrobiales bacterium]
MRVLIVPDKFKGTLSARQAAEAIARGWSESRPGDELTLLPMSDGGDGFGHVVGELLQAERVASQGVNAAGEPHEASWWWSSSTRTAIIETAQAIGLALLPKGKYHPFELDTFALGKMFSDAAAKNPAHTIIGIGGSATNDAGFGMARGVGFRFLDAEGKEITRWTELKQLEAITPPVKQLFNGRITVAVDVQNPLLGPNGASRVYGPQKGMRPEDFPLADQCFERLIQVAARDLRQQCETEPGTGAAGGLGYALRAFLSGTFKPGIDIFAEVANLGEKIAASDLVITAEGAIDAQTLMGKGTGAIAVMARENRVRCFGLAGMLKDVEQTVSTPLFTQLAGITPSLTTLENAMSEPAYWLSALAKSFAKSF